MADGAYVLRFRRCHAQELLFYPPRTAALVRRWDWRLTWEGYLPLGDRISRLRRRLQTEPLDAVADHALDLRENMGLAFQTFNKMSDAAHIEVIGMQIPCRPSITADMQGVKSIAGQALSSHSVGANAERVMTVDNTSMAERVKMHATTTRCSLRLSEWVASLSPRSSYATPHTSRSPITATVSSRDSAAQSVGTRRRRLSLRRRASASIVSLTRSRLQSARITSSWARTGTNSSSSARCNASVCSSSEPINFTLST